MNRNTRRAHAVAIADTLTKLRTARLTLIATGATAAFIALVLIRGF